MIDAPLSVIEKLESGKFDYGNLITINLGDAYGEGSDVFIRYTDYGHDIIDSEGNVFSSDNTLLDLDGITRKLATGSDEIKLTFGLSDKAFISAIKAKRYYNKATSIERVIIENGEILEDYKIPVRTAWGKNHKEVNPKEGESEITLVLDSALGGLNGANAWRASNASHQSRYPDDYIMNFGTFITTGTGTKTFRGGIFEVEIYELSEVPSDYIPNSLPKSYGYVNATPVPVFKWLSRKNHSFYTHYFSYYIYVVNIGDVQHADLNNMLMDGDEFNYSIVNDQKYDHGGWSFRLRTTAQNQTSIADDPDLNFWKENLGDADVLQPFLSQMYGKGLTLLFAKNRNRDAILSNEPEFTFPMEASIVRDPRNSTVTYSTNPGLQYADYLTSTKYGAAGVSDITIDDSNVGTIADHFDNLPNTTGNDGIDHIEMGVTIDTGDSLVDNLATWNEGARLYSTDYYGVYNVSIEKAEDYVYHIDSADDKDDAEYDSGDFTDRLTQLTYGFSQFILNEETDLLEETDLSVVYPESDSDLFATFLEEDGGILNSDEVGSDYVNNSEQALYWAMVDVKKSREPRTLQITTGYVAWLFEVGDTITYTNDELELNQLVGWRIEEISDKNNGVELSLVSYDDTFYLPDPDAIPTPPALGYRQVSPTLPAVIGIDVQNNQDNYYLTWTPLDEPVSYYSVEVLNDQDEILYSYPEQVAPPVLIPEIGAGDYSVKIVANHRSYKDEGETASYNFSIVDLVTPSDTSQLIIPSVKGMITIEPPTPEYDNRTYQWRYHNENDATVVYWGENKVFNLSPILAGVSYTVEYRLISTISAVGHGDWVDIDITPVGVDSYSWKAYADDASGTNISITDSTKPYTGIAVGMSTPTVDITDESVFLWVKTTDGLLTPIAQLSSYSIGINTDSDGSNGNYSAAEVTMTILYGSADDTSAYTLTANDSDGITGSLVGNTYSVTNMTVDSGYVTLTAVRTGYPTLTARATFNKVKSGVSGQNGRSIIGTSKNGEILTIYYNDNTSDDFTVSDGDPADPLTVADVSNNNGTTTITLSDNSTFTIDDGQAGVGIANINKSGETVTVTFDDGSNETFTVSDGTDGSFIGYAYQNAVDQPDTPTGGSYNGTIETPPSGATLTPSFEYGKITWRSQTVYSKTGNTWSNSGWTDYGEHVIQGEDGKDGANAPESVVFEQTVTWNKNVDDAGTTYPNHITSDIALLNVSESKTYDVYVTASGNRRFDNTGPDDDGGGGGDEQVPCRVWVAVLDEDPDGENYNGAFISAYSPSSGYNTASAFSFSESMLNVSFAEYPVRALCQVQFNSNGNADEGTFTGTLTLRIIEK